jgi:glycosyltransferase involved in cell wall biosynthesis
MKKAKTQAAKKILFIHHGTGIGGASLSLLYLVTSLDLNLFEPIVLFMADSPAVKMFVEHQIQVLGPLNLSDFSHTKIWWYRWYHPHHFLKACFHSINLLTGIAATWLERIEPDLVHLNTSSLFAWAVVAKWKQIPVIWHVREPLAEGYLGLRRKFISWIVAVTASKIVSICKDNAHPWAENAKVQIVYNAVPEKKFRKDATITPKKPTVLFLGGLSEAKGTLLLLQSWLQVVALLPEAELIIAGEWQPKLGALSDHIPLTPWHFFCRSTLQLTEQLKSRVQLVGLSTDVPTLISKANLLVFPATVGHFARPIIEAGFMGKPTVATDVAPMRELIIDGNTGLLAAKDDAKDLAQKMLMILKDEILATTLSRKAKVFCYKNFGLTKQQKIMLSIYKAVLNN